MAENILAIDASTEACSVALSNGSRVFEEFHLAPRKHAELLIPLVDSVLQQASIGLNDVDAIACSLGPGAFTGLRIAISTAQGLAYAAGIPCIGISSLETLAYQAFEQHSANYALVSIDARMNEVYFASFKRTQQSLPQLMDSEQVIAPGIMSLPTEITGLVKDNTAVDIPVVKVGNGWKVYDCSDDFLSIEEAVPALHYPNAKYMLPIAIKSFYNKRLTKAEFLQPVYLRNNVAKKKSCQK